MLGWKLGMAVHMYMQFSVHSIDSDWPCVEWGEIEDGGEWEVMGGRRVEEGGRLVGAVEWDVI